MENDIFDDDLYRSIIIDHSSAPRNLRELEHHTCKIEGINSSCGDALVLELDVKDGIVKEVAFNGQGCSIFTASTSILTEIIKGKTVQEAEEIARCFRAHILSEDLEKYKDIDMEELEALYGVKDLPARVKCALLSWNTLLRGLGKGVHGEDEDEDEYED